MPTSQLAQRAGRTAEALAALEEVHRLEARVGLIGGSPFYSQGLARCAAAGGGSRRNGELRDKTRGVSRSFALNRGCFLSRDRRKWRANRS
jgi:hypothetical protein